MGSKANKRFLPREQVVRKAIAFWRGKPGAEDTLAGLAAEDEQKKRRRKKSRRTPKGVKLQAI